MRLAIAVGVASIIALPVSAAPIQKLKTVCQMIVDDQGRSLVSEGKCSDRISPASTFKVPLSLMGFDDGYLKSPSAPKLPVKKGYNIYLPEWGQATDPQRWMRYSVVWYSQEIVKALGEEKLRNYLRELQYGNQDMSGHKGADPKMGFWIGSSLKISPAEQVGFMRKLMSGNLHFSKGAIENTKAIMDLGVQKNGWHLFGKTGSGTPRTKDGKRLKNETFGWFVGFAEKDGRKVAFSKLIQSGNKEKMPLGLLAREQVIGDYFGKDSPL